MLFALLFTGLMARGDSLPWNDLESAKKYILNSDIAITESIKLSKGDAFSLEDVSSGEIPVIYFEMKNLMCTDNSLKSEVVLFNPEPDDHAHDKSIGVELEENCMLGIYVEPQFYYDISVFSESVQFRPLSSVRSSKP